MQRGGPGTVSGRVVVCALGGFVRDGHLPASTYLDRRWIYGGERSMYEIAAAVAVAGHTVELRGDLSRPALEAILSASGATVETSLPSRLPQPDDVIIVPEGITDPGFYDAIGGRGARRVMALLGPPGLFGPALEEGFSAPDSLTVPLDQVGTVEQYRQIAGFELWTNSPRVAAEAAEAGVECLFVGTGQPVPFPDHVPKLHPVAYVGANRWAPLARQAASAVSVSVLEISEGGRDSVVRAIASAQLLLLPVRIEGQSRLQLEARAVGTVPIALSSNRYAAGMDEAGGAVLVDSVEEMALAIEQLLADPDRLGALSRRARSTARAQLDWRRYVTRVAAALHRAPVTEGVERPG